MPPPIWARIEVGVGELTLPLAGDALTVNGYLGSDGIQSAADGLRGSEDKGIFVLVKTSIPPPASFRTGSSTSRPCIEVMGEMCRGLGRRSCRASMATRASAPWWAPPIPRSSRSCGEKLPHTFFLVPGYGAQGGGATDVAGAFDSTGLRRGHQLLPRHPLCLAERKAAPGRTYARRRPPGSHADAGRESLGHPPT